MYAETFINQMHINNRYQIIKIINDVCYYCIRVYKLADTLTLRFITCDVIVYYVQLE